jgi:hypothetical protein
LRIFDNVKKVMKNGFGEYGRTRETLPLGGEGKGGGERLPEMPFLPLTLTLSPKGRGEVIFDNTGFSSRRFRWKRNIQQ